MDNPISPLDKAITFCGAFEAELLVRLMMERWGHPTQADSETVAEIVEVAAEVLQRSKLGEKLIEELEPEDMNFVAAVWYAEFCQCDDVTDPDISQRREWLERIRRAIPSCFCDPNDLA